MTRRLDAIVEPLTLDAIPDDALDALDEPATLDAALDAPPELRRWDMRPWVPTHTLAP